MQVLCRKWPTFVSEMGLSLGVFTIGVELVGFTDLICASTRAQVHRPAARKVRLRDPSDAHDARRRHPHLRVRRQHHLALGSGPIDTHRTVLPSNIAGGVRGCASGICTNLLDPKKAKNCVPREHNCRTVQLWHW